ncbi:MAG: patatin-like phospholipase family protein [Treponema sp.]|nr:patatin-like phospholipase family protein [Treponema sp.]
MRNNRFVKIALFIFILGLSPFFNLLSAQSGSNLMIAEDDAFLLQSTPIYEGIDEFEAKLNKIRTEQNREPLGLVLCGGSARAFAHIGALKAMEENEITPDFIVANSMGAIIGMFYSYGFSPDKIEEIISNINLTQYFEPVIPIHGGVLSVRKFRALVNDLLGKEHTDLNECPIPIVILTEDLYTKRQIWHASGDFANIMTAAFAMSAIMEPTKYNLKENGDRPVLLIDSGAIDIAGLSIAEHFSPNIIISTAFYDAELNYNNMIVVLNRTMSIGKERQAAEDIKKFKPVIIRNDVEHFSFMAFDKAKELSDIGYTSAMEVISEIKVCPHLYNPLTERRQYTDSLADATIHHVHTNETLKQDENYFGIKIWPVFPAVDYPDYSLYNYTGISAFIFEDASSFYAKFGATIPFNYNRFCAEGLIRYNPSSFFDASIFASYSFSYEKCTPVHFFGAATAKIRPDFFPYAMKSILTTFEYSGDYKLTPDEILFKTGLDVEQGNDINGYIAFKPYYFISGTDLKSLSNGIGASVLSSVNSSIFAKKTPKVSFGIADNASVRYAVNNFNKSENAETRLYSSDFYRAEKPENPNDLVFSNKTELFFVNLDPGITAAELLILQQYKIGAFYDLAYNGTYNQCAGGFARAQISLIGLCNFIFEGGCGWNITEDCFFGYFEMKNRI